MHGVFRAFVWKSGAPGRLNIYSFVSCCLHYKWLLNSRVGGWLPVLSGSVVGWVWRRPVIESLSIVQLMSTGVLSQWWWMVVLAWDGFGEVRVLTLPVLLVAWQERRSVGYCAWQPYCLTASEDICATINLAVINSYYQLGSSYQKACSH